tara:strand:- start:42 stop:287 length:246 start_codon:yes stop_codon:yes gene_type:complete
LKDKMPYTIDDIEKIAEYKSWSKKRKVDTLLEIDADLYCNLGIESTKTEIEAIKIQSRKIYRLIKTIDEYSGKLLLRNEAR